jgi:hypothetical protein
VLKQKEVFKMQTLLVNLIFFAVVGAVFLIALTRPGRTAMLAKFFDAFWGWADYRPKDWSNGNGRGDRATNGAVQHRGGTAMLAKFFDAFWGWADYRPKDRSNASYKRGYTSEE